MNLPGHVIYDRSAQELEDMVVQFMTERSIPTSIMELILYKVLNRVQILKDYDIANMHIREEQIREEVEREKKKKEEQKQAEEKKAEVANE